MGAWAVATETAEAAKEKEVVARVREVVTEAVVRVVERGVEVWGVATVVEWVVEVRAEEETGGALERAEETEAVRVASMEATTEVAMKAVGVEREAVERAVVGSGSGGRAAGLEAEEMARAVVGMEGEEMAVGVAAKVVEWEVVVKAVAGMVKREARAGGEAEEVARAVAGMEAGEMVAVVLEVAWVAAAAVMGAAAKVAVGKEPADWAAGRAGVESPGGRWWLQSGSWPRADRCIRQRSEATRTLRCRYRPR